MRAASLVLAMVPLAGCTGDGWTGAEETHTVDTCEPSAGEVPPGVVPAELPGFDGAPATAELVFVYAQRTETLQYWFEPTQESARWDSCSQELSHVGLLHVRSSEGTFDEVVEGELHHQAERGDFSSFTSGFREPCAAPCVLSADLQGTYAEQQLAADVAAFTEQPAEDFPLVAIEFQLFFPGEDVAERPCTVVALLREELTTTMTIATLGERCSSAPPYLVEETWEEAKASPGCDTKGTVPGSLLSLFMFIVLGRRPRLRAPG
jgi:hypothetical protein